MVGDYYFSLETFHASSYTMKLINDETHKLINVMSIEYFKLTVKNNKNLEVFMNTFNLESLINKPTCFQSPNSTCIDLILTNRKSLFKNSNVLEVPITITS